MANHCSNDIKITGSRFNVTELHDRITKFLDNSDEGYWGATYYTMFRTMHPKFHQHDDPEKQKELNEGFDVYDEYGSKWWDLDSVDFDRENCILYLSGYSAWGPVLPLCSKLALEYDLEITCEFNEPGMDFAGEYKFDSTGCIDQKDYTSGEYEYLQDKQCFIDQAVDNHDCFDNYESYLEAYEKIFKKITLDYKDLETVSEIKLAVKDQFDQLKEEELKN